MIGFVEFEGYLINKKFYFKEVVIYFQDSNEYRHVFISAPKLGGSTYHWLTKHFHKIPYHYGGVSYKYELYPLLSQFHTLFVKGEVKQKILQKITPASVINLENLGCPAFHTLSPPIQVNCVFHQDINKHCALYKFKQLKHWIENEYSTTLREALSNERSKVSQGNYQMC